MNQKKTAPLWTAPFVLLLVINIFNATAGQMTFPLVAKFSLSLGADLTLASTTAGLISLAALFVCPFAGVISDYFSRKKILQVCSIAYAVSLLLHAFCGSMPLLIILRLVTGIFFSVINARNTRQVTLSIVGLHPINNLGRNILHRHLLIV